MRHTMRLSGHRSLRMATRYHKVADPEMRTAVETLEQAFAGEAPDRSVRLDRQIRENGRGEE